MANLLIGRGETLTGPIKIRRGGGEKAFPYDIDNRRQSLVPQIVTLREAMRALPEEAKPRGEATALITVHPAFIAKSHFPDSIIRKAGLRAVGSRPAMVQPQWDVRPEIASGLQPSAQIYVSGREAHFQWLEHLLVAGDTPTRLQEDLRKIESINLLAPGGRLIPIGGDDPLPKLELVLHAIAPSGELFQHLLPFAASWGATIDAARHLLIDGLIFVPAAVPRAVLAQFCLYTALRAVRRMPQLRVSRPELRVRVESAGTLELPEKEALHPDVEVAVFDGGLNHADFARWCTEHTVSETETTSAECLTHGTEVTSAMLFGALAPSAPVLPVPPFRVVHHRVICPRDYDVDLYDVMHRIDSILSEHEYRFANFSLGPRLAIDDSQPHAWTCMLDRHLASGELLATVAVGNDGALADELGRIQPPADAVNALGVGAADSTDFLWRRADYSCRGPGRSPGLVKPDGVAFGGERGNPLVLYSPYQRGLTGVCGTSFASPLVLRAAAMAAGASETPLSATLLRALLVHRADPAGHAREEVGWGRFPNSLEELLVCPDNEATVLYQGTLHPGAPIRAAIPVPAIDLGTKITLTATFCFACQVDPADPVNYTRRGLTIVFRPMGGDSTDRFFSTAEYGSEQDLRRDAAKWETVLHRSRLFGAHELAGPVFDIQLGTRRKGLRTSKKVTPTPYVLIVTIAADRRMPLYNDVLAQYVSLRPILLRQQVQIRT